LSLRKRKEIQEMPRGSRLAALQAQTNGSKTFLLKTNTQLNAPGGRLNWPKNIRLQLQLEVDDESCAGRVSGLHMGIETRAEEISLKAPI
jgi:hypothetical protein